jgi:hypothetical protein
MKFAIGNTDNEKNMVKKGQFCRILWKNDDCTEHYYSLIDTLTGKRFDSSCDFWTILETKRCYSREGLSLFDSNVLKLFMARCWEEMYDENRHIMPNTRNSITVIEGILEDRNVEY